MRFELSVPDWDDLLSQMAWLASSGVTPANFEAWMQQWSDIESELRDHWLMLLEHTYHDSNDEVAKQQYRALIRDVIPRFEKPREVLRQAIHSSEASVRLSPYLKRVFEAESRLFDETNTLLIAEERKLIQDAEAVMADQKVILGELPVTLATARAKLKTCQDREERRTLWLAMQEAKAKNQDELSRIYIELVKLRRQIAENAGFADYRAYAWYARNRFDYTPEDCLTLVEQVMQIFAPVRHIAANYRKRNLGVEQYRPWDIQVDLSKTANESLLDEQDVLRLAQTGYTSLDAEFGAVIGRMIEQGRADLLTRVGKAATNHSSYFSRTGEPLVVTHVAGHETDLRIVLHEFGHAVHYACSGKNAWYWDKGGITEISELVAYLFQTLVLEELKQHLSASSHNAIQQFVFEFIVDLFDLVAETERFQHWVYTQAPQGLDKNQLNEAFLGFAESGSVDWGGLESFRALGWQDPFIIKNPFYNVDYIIALIGTLVIASQANQERALVLEQLKSVLPQGKRLGMVGQLKLFGLEFPFSVTHLIQARTALLHGPGNGIEHNFGV